VKPSWGAPRDSPTGVFRPQTVGRAEIVTTSLLPFDFARLRDLKDACFGILG
jgi:hypothetical protein